MFIEPLSKVSVPLVVVIRKRSSVADRVLLPAEKTIKLSFEFPSIPFNAQVPVVAFNNVRTADPFRNSDAITELNQAKPVLDAGAVE